eukprot:6150036-Pleurochrysis_carterae.AAC.6
MPLDEKSRLTRRGGVGPNTAGADAGADGAGSERAVLCGLLGAWLFVTSLKISFGTLSVAEVCVPMKTSSAPLRCELSAVSGGTVGAAFGPAAAVAERVAASLATGATALEMREVKPST